MQTSPRCRSCTSMGATITSRPRQPKRATCEPAMFVIELVYKADLKKIDAHMTAHVKFLKKYYADGTFLVSGRKIPRDGGIILAAGKSKPEIEALIKEDPFHQHGLAEFRVIEFRASQRRSEEHTSELQ